MGNNGMHRGPHLIGNVYSWQALDVEVKVVKLQVDVRLGISVIFFAFLLFVILIGKADAVSAAMIYSCNR